MEKPELFYATTNPGKISEVGKFAAECGYVLTSPADLPEDQRLSVEETGDTLEENAILKADAWRKKFPERVIIADDTGFEIDALDGEPGVHVKRWRDGKTRMKDDEVVAYCMERMAGIPQERRGAQTRTAIALAMPGDDVVVFEGVLRGEVLPEPDEQYRVNGFPLERFFFVPEWGMMLGETRKIPVAERQQFITHREKAVRQAIEYLNEHQNAQN